MAHWTSGGDGINVLVRCHQKSCGVSSEIWSTSSTLILPSTSKPYVYIKLCHNSVKSLPVDLTLTPPETVHFLGYFCSAVKLQVFLSLSFPQGNKKRKHLHEKIWIKLVDFYRDVLLCWCCYVSASQDSNVLPINIHDSVRILFFINPLSCLNSALKHSSITAFML